MECNQAQGFTACGIDALRVVCSFDPASQSGCLHDSGPCHHGLTRDGYVGECQGRSQYAIHLPTETDTRPTKKHQQARSALSLAVAALCEMTYHRNDETRAREEIFLKALAEIRMVAGDIRLTSMRVTCAWCNKEMGHKEGNGSTGETSTICPECFKAQMGQHVPEEVRRIAAGIYGAIGMDAAPAKVTGNSPEEFMKSLGNAMLRPETRETAKVAALAVPRLEGEMMG
jgi:hypothetical protein